MMTCGNGIAMQAALPARLARLAAAMAEVLENHRRSIDPKDAEDPAYLQLVGDYRGLANSLDAVARRMEGYHDLPMAAHDEAALGDAQSREAFARFVDAERELLALLGKWAARDAAMLEEWD